MPKVDGAGLLASDGFVASLASLADPELPESPHLHSGAVPRAIHWASSHWHAAASGEVRIALRFSQLAGRTRAKGSSVCRATPSAKTCQGLLY